MTCARSECIDTTNRFFSSKYLIQFYCPHVLLTERCCQFSLLKQLQVFRQRPLSAVGRWTHLCHFCTEKLQIIFWRVILSNNRAPSSPSMKSKNLCQVTATIRLSNNEKYNFAVTSLWIVSQETVVDCNRDREDTMRCKWRHSCTNVLILSISWPNESDKLSASEPPFSCTSPQKLEPSSDCSLIRNQAEITSSLIYITRVSSCCSLDRRYQNSIAVSLLLMQLLQLSKPPLFSSVRQIEIEDVNTPSALYIMSRHRVFHAMSISNSTWRILRRTFLSVMMALVHHSRLKTVENNSVQDSLLRCADTISFASSVRLWREGV